VTEKGGTPRAIGPIAEQVLAWVANERAERNDPDYPFDHPALRRIELCALAAREAAMFFELYGIPTDWRPPEC